MARVNSRAGFARPHLWLAILLMLAGAQSGSRPVAAQQGANDLLKRLEGAAALVRNNRIAEAEREIAFVLKIAPGEAGALNLLGTIRAQQGKLEEAESLFLRAVSSDREFVGPHMNLAYLYLLKREPDKTISALKEALRIDPKNADAAEKLAQLLFSRNQIEEGVSLVERMKEEGQPAAPLLVALGDAYASNSNFERAEENYLLAVARQSDNVDAVLGLARSAHARGDAQTAFSRLTRARELSAGSPDALYRLAVVALKLNFGGEALDAVGRALELKPETPPYLLLQGIAWLRKPDMFEAEKSFRRFLELQPDSAQGQMFLGYSLLKQKRTPEARLWLEKSIKTELNMPEPFYYLGLIAQEQNEDLRAVELLEKAVKILPSYAHAHTALGASYLRLKNFERARQELELAVKLNSEDSKAHYQLALLYARLKDQARAQEQMRIVEKLKNASKGNAAADQEISAPAQPPQPR
ncbi:MAG TPA: tetratricopeptide repeat protein [Pyrinomonadaceae bacterium]|nr:tetratricopeptide repeat protein [Pyrinomonadaceae bacterium]